MSDQRVPARTNMPYFALGSAVVLIVVTVVTLAFANPDKTSTPLFVTVIGLVATSVPSLIAAAFAERVSKDVRNGTLVQKSKQATHEALREAGIVTSHGPAMTLAMEGLAQVLRQTKQPSTQHIAQQIEQHVLAGEDNNQKGHGA